MLTKIPFRKIIKAICFVIMLLQIIYLSIDYFSYPFSIKVDINYDKKQTLPSITLCTERNFFISKTQIKDNYPDIYLKILKHERDYDFCTMKGNDAQKCETNYPKFKQESNSIFEEIRYRNSINTSLKQLFERTLHLDEWIGCKVYFKDGRVINCLEIERLVEKFNGLNFYGKCFAYFNREQEYNGNIFENFSITKEDFIEFKISAELFRDTIYPFNSVITERNSPVMAIHSFKTSASVSDFIDMILNNYARGSSTRYNFGKTTYKSLEWPYNTDCDYYNRNNLYHSRENCIEYCNLYNQNLSQGCLKDPPTKSSFSVSNRIMNKAFRHLKVCENPNKSSIHFKCEKLCKRDCFEYYYRYNI
jgi:hypothetical protein